MFDWFNKLFLKSARQSQTKSGGGEMVYDLPFEPGSRFLVLQGYGGPYSHAEEWYYSLDFQMPEGTPVCASRAGIVYYVVNHFIDGGTDHSFKPKANAVYVLHPDDSIAAYLHLKHRGNCVVAGDTVTAGQVVGYSGNTGWSGTPHLHFHVMDAIRRETIPTKFNTAECGTTTLDANRQYTNPASRSEIPKNRATRIDDRICSDITRDAFAFSPELLQLAEALETISRQPVTKSCPTIHRLKRCKMSTGLRFVESEVRIIPLK